MSCNPGLLTQQVTISLQGAVGSGKSRMLEEISKFLSLHYKVRFVGEHKIEVSNF